MTIYEVCLECKNFFLKNGDRDIHSGTFTVDNGSISDIDFLIPEQYFRVVGSKLNDGVYLNTAEGLAELKNETFDGAIWDMSVPPAFVAMCEEIGKWQEKYGTADSAALSPFNSESFGGYSYSKSSGSSASGGDSTATWQGAYSAQLRKWRRLNIL